MMRLSLGFPDLKAEKKILLSNTHRTTTQRVDQGTQKQQNENESVVDEAGLLAMQEAVTQVTVSNDVIEYIIALSHVSRRAYTGQNNIGDSTGALSSEIVCKPLSPRASKSLLQAAKAMAFIDNRDYVLPDDVQAVFYVVCQHRLEIQPSQHVDLSQAELTSVANQILNSVDVLNPLGH
jgi:MoxR-like ATPase